ncbi:MAG: iron ABC transporter permease [Deltaproteobacteria bacterium]|nr:iron ABC transporter permease [Deltaproteobacteria bacterium]
MIRLRTVASTGLLVLVVLLVLPPFLMLLVGSFWGGAPGAPGQISLRSYIQAYTSPHTYQVLLNSILISFSKTCLAVVWGVVLAWLVTRTDVPFRRTMEVLIPVPFFIPALFTTFAWILLANPHNGLVNQVLTRVFGPEFSPFNIYSYGGIIFVMALGSTSFVYILTFGAFRGLDPALEEAARACGAGWDKTFVRITLPLVAPALLGASILSFIRGIEAFEGPVLLGTPVGIYVFTNEIYRAITFYDPPQYGVATALGMTVILITFILVFIQWCILGERQYFTITGKGYNPHTIRLRGWRWPAFCVFALYFLLAVVFPVGQLVASSFQRTVGVYGLELMTLDNYRRAFSEEIVLRALQNTLILAIAASSLGVLLSALIAYVTTRTQFWGRRLMELISWLPWTMPGIVLAVGMLWAYLSIPGLSVFYGTLGILLIAFVMKGLPLGVRALSGTIVQVDRELEDCARVHGATWMQTFWSIMLYLIRPGMVAGGMLFAYITVRDLSTPVLLYGYGTEVLSIAMLQFWAESKPQIVSVLAVVMLLLLMILSGAQRWLLIKGEPLEESEAPVDKEVAGQLTGT